MSWCCSIWTNNWRRKMSIPRMFQTAMWGVFSKARSVHTCSIQREPSLDNGTSHLRLNCILHSADKLSSALTKVNMSSRWKINWWLFQTETVTNSTMSKSWCGDSKMSIIWKHLGWLVMPCSNLWHLENRTATLVHRWMFRTRLIFVTPTRSATSASWLLCCRSFISIHKNEFH